MVRTWALPNLILISHVSCLMSLMSLRKMNNCLLITDIIFYKQREKNNNLRVRGEINVGNYIFILSHFYKVISLGDI